MASIETGPGMSQRVEGGQEPVVNEEVDIEEEASKLAMILVYLLQNDLAPDAAPSFYNYMVKKRLDVDQVWPRIESHIISQDPEATAVALESFRNSLEAESNKSAQD